MKKRILCLLLACLLPVLWGCDMISPSREEPAQESQPTQSTEAIQPQTLEGPGYDSPEEAILAYAHALKSGDVEQILSTFAVESYVEHFDLAAWIDFTGTYTVAAPQLLPGSDPYTVSLNLFTRQNQIIENLTYLYLTFSSVENFYAPVPMDGEPYEKASEIVNDLAIYGWQDMLAKMEIGDVLDAEAVGLDLIGINRQMGLQREYLRCQTLTALAVEITIDGEEYYLCVDVACYGEKWYNCKPCGIIASYLGAPSMSGGLYPLED